MSLVRDLKLYRAWERCRASIERAKGDPVKVIPSIVTLLITALGLFQPEVQALLVAHPAASIAVGGIYSIVQHLMPSPIGSSTGVAPAKK